MTLVACLDSVALLVELSQSNGRVLVRLGEDLVLIVISSADRSRARLQARDQYREPTADAVAASGLGENDPASLLLACYAAYREASSSGAVTRRVSSGRIVCGPDRQVRRITRASRAGSIDSKTASYLLAIRAKALEHGARSCLLSG